MFGFTRAPSAAAPKQASFAVPLAARIPVQWIQEEESEQEEKKAGSGGPAVCRGCSGLKEARILSCVIRPWP